MAGDDKDIASETSTGTTTEPIHINGQADLDAVIGESDVVLTDFYADWCGPCQMLEPIVETIATDSDAAVAKVNIDANQQLATAYGVRGVPTIIVFADGTQVEGIVGMQGEDQLRSLIGRYTE